MFSKTVGALVLLATSAIAQVPICNKYATAFNISEKTLVTVSFLALAGAIQPLSPSFLFPVYRVCLLTEFSFLTSQTVLTVALLGNSASNPPVAGILDANSPVLNLFTGVNATTNHYNLPTKINFLDGGAAASLQNGTIGTACSNQYTLVTHLVEYVGFLLNCNATGFPAYAGNPSMYDVHKFMNISQIQFAYFDNAIANAALSLGVTTADFSSVGAALNSLYGSACLAPVRLPPTLIGSQSICQGPGCNNTTGAPACYAVSPHTTTAAGAASSSLTAAGASFVNGKSGAESMIMSISSLTASLMVVGSVYMIAL
ncbi:hypothetical protein BDK51DRAFT_39977 [Blyttiomyces helicus]|uniref:Uncharacterized protein n=1 Tax=Blyttiomyces helicus TaxID=388810 RepID=A0A4P9W0R8_9FUNG|nr:hypothetical protein BDK51DRAFT_39977 [Blyttiomyces helicus]|eukprot:RKO85751.1 hypothetical protein BDK51DRAFT_39977 [Blyttiomyces helicus]